MGSLSSGGPSGGGFERYRLWVLKNSPSASNSQNLGDAKCLPASRTSLISHPDANQFLQFLRKRVFQHPRLISPVDKVSAEFGLWAGPVHRGTLADPKRPLPTADKSARYRGRSRSMQSSRRSNIASPYTLPNRGVLWLAGWGLAFSKRSWIVGRTL